MPPPQVQYYNFTAGPVSLTSAVETVAATTRAVSSSYPNCTYGIFCAFAFTTGAGATGANMRIRRDSLTGTIVYASTTFAVVASVVNLIVVACTDSIAGDQAGQTWVITCVTTGGAVAGSATNIYTQVTVAQ